MFCLAPTPSSSATRCHGPIASCGASAGAAANSDSKRATAAAIAAASAPVAVFSATRSLYGSAPGKVATQRVDDRRGVAGEPRFGHPGDEDPRIEQLVGPHPVQSQAAVQWLATHGCAASTAAMQRPSQVSPRCPTT